MTRVQYEGASYEVRTGESVLDALLRQGVSPPFSCRSGSCLACLQRSVSGAPPPASQRALRPALRAAGYFLPCKCVPTEDLTLAPPRPEDLYVTAVLTAREPLTPDLFRLRLTPTTVFSYRAGQFVTVRTPGGAARSYSLASLPDEDGDELELHVRRVPGGAASPYLCDELAVGAELELQGPNGRFHYVPGSQERPLLLVGTGTGGAPALGVVRDALASGHAAPIQVIHGARSAEGLYLAETFGALAGRHPRLRYEGVVSPTGDAAALVAALPERLDGVEVFLAGAPDLVARLEAEVRRRGAADVHVDPHAPPAPAPSRPIAEGSMRRARVARPADPELWRALGEGTRLREILEDFYARVFEDEVLAPYFRGVTRERLVGQVFSFMRDALTGERQYFGMQPRTAHHWMVISDEIFDHREALMEDTLRRHGLSEPLVQRWRLLEESFRGDVVKEVPWPLVLDGVEMPLEGFGEADLEVGTMCDGCGRAIEAGEHVRYHLRLGSTYCRGCGAPAAAGAHP